MEISEKTSFKGKRGEKKRNNYKAVYFKAPEKKNTSREAERYQKAKLMISGRIAVLISSEVRKGKVVKTLAFAHADKKQSDAVY